MQKTCTTRITRVCIVLVTVYIQILKGKLLARCCNVAFVRIGFTSYILDFRLLFRSAQCLSPLETYILPMIFLENLLVEETLQLSVSSTDFYVCCSFQEMRKENPSLMNSYASLVCRNVRFCPSTRVL
jgi:hypothetical protein